jgi:bifunctional DNA-binding transcriptional regulator/antitoxin component of YhaV-PrlF toxin-antitoxin module
MKLQAAAIIRDRGQLTIPGDIRDVLDWTAPASVVTVYLEMPNKLVIQPYRVEKQIEWDGLWSQIKLARTFIG